MYASLHSPLGRIEPALMPFSRKIHQTLACLSFFLMAGPTLRPAVASGAPSQIASQTSTKDKSSSPALDATASLQLFDAAVQTVEADLPKGSELSARWSGQATSTRATLEALLSRPKATRNENSTTQNTAVNGETLARDAVNSLLHIAPEIRGRLYGNDEQPFWALSTVFSGKRDSARLRQIGAWLERRGKRWFVRRVFADSPAERAGLLRGDEIVSVGGLPLAPVISFASLRPNATVNIKYRRLPWGTPQTLTLQTVSESFVESAWRDTAKGARIRNVQNKRIAYLPLWSATHPEIHAALLAAARAAEHDADAMVLDLRGGFGGGDLSYLDSVFAVPSDSDKGGIPQRAAAFDKPLVALIDAETSGGKEWLAWLIHREHRGQLVGAPTAGARQSGHATELEPHRALLYLAEIPTAGVTDAPVVPDQAESGSLMYAAGSDRQLDRALGLAAAAAVGAAAQ